MRRRKYIALSGVSLVTALAGCGEAADEEPEQVDDDEDTPASDDTDDEDAEAETEAETEAEVEAAIGDLVEGDNVHLVVEGVERTTEVGEFAEADSGNEFVVVALAMKNVSSEFLTVSNLLQTSLEDEEGYSYDQTFVGDSDAQFNDGQFAPGEVERGSIAYEVPEDAAGLTLRFDFDVSIFGGVERAYIDLESEGDDVTLEQELEVDVYDLGETIAFNGVEVAVEDVEYDTELGMFAEAEEGNEYAIVDIAVTNETGEDRRISTGLQMMVKDGNGRSYQEDLMATSDLDRDFDEGSPIPDGDTRRGRLAYEIPEGAAPLYWVFEFDVWVEGDKTFWALR